MRFDKEEKNTIIHNPEDYPLLHALIEKQNEYDFNNPNETKP